jgi:DNA-binding MarR family transcriptional regulator
VRQAAIATHTKLLSWLIVSLVNNVLDSFFAVNYNEHIYFGKDLTQVPPKNNSSALPLTKAYAKPSPAKPSNAGKAVASLRTAEQLRDTNNQLQNSLAYAIKRTQVRCDEALVRYLDRELTPARFAALSTIGANPGISQTALGGLLNIAGASVVKVVDELERLELLRRDPSADRRVYALQLTEKGATDLLRYQTAVEAFEKQIASHLTREERAQLITLLAKVAPEEA